MGSFLYTTSGYTNPLTCYTELVDGNRDEYTAEYGDGFEVFCEHEEITKLEDISEEYKEQLRTDAKDRIESYMANENKDSINLDGLTLAGEYLLTAKSQGTDYEQNNKYVAVYSGTVSSPGGNFETQTIYFPVEYDGLVKLPKKSPARVRMEPAPVFSIKSYPVPRLCSSITPYPFTRFLKHTIGNIPTNRTSGYMEPAIGCNLRIFTTDTGSRRNRSHS